MSAILDFVKNYFIFMLILFLFSYLAPRQVYKKYYQFFIGVLMVAILVKPFLKLLGKDMEGEVREQIMEWEDEMERMEYYDKGEDIYERFLESYEEDTEFFEKPE